MISRDTDRLREHLARVAFAPSASDLGSRIGAEVEFLALERATGRPAPIDVADRPSTLPVFREVAREARWTEQRSAKAGVPEFITPTGGRLTFEPGGQVEYAAPPRTSVGALVADLHETVGAIDAPLNDAGIALVAAGIDPLNPIDDVPLQLTGERYRRMDAHFATIGPHGARMMRQTASIQVCLDAGPRPLERWTLLNALAPYLVAIFANSPRYAGELSGHQSLRRFVWGALDPRRTGLAWDATDPVGAYADFALGAPDVLHDGESPPFAPFGTLLADGRVGAVDWESHLSTLFPEVRPRGYYEVRSTDALAPAWYAAPLAFLAGIIGAPAAAGAAGEITGAPDADLLERAGRCGLADPAIARRAAELYGLALRAGESAGRSVIDEPSLAVAWEFFERYTRRGRSPAADAPVAIPG